MHGAIRKSLVTAARCTRDPMHMRSILMHIIKPWLILLSIQCTCPSPRRRFFVFILTTLSVFIAVIVCMQLSSFYSCNRTSGIHNVVVDVACRYDFALALFWSKILFVGFAHLSIFLASNCFIIIVVLFKLTRGSGRWTNRRKVSTQFFLRSTHYDDLASCCFQNADDKLHEKIRMFSLGKFLHNKNISKVHWTIFFLYNRLRR